MSKQWTSTFDVGKVRSLMGAASPEALEEAAAHVFNVAQRDVPYEKGDLSRSGASGLVSPTRAAVTYRDRSAVPAHERTDLRAANGRKRKWLESAMNSERGEAAKIIGSVIRRRLGT